MEVIDDRISTSSSRLARYRLWKSHLYKWSDYLDNRHKTIKYVDSWSQKFFDSARGRCAAYASGGLYYKDIRSSIMVIEHTICPINIAGMSYINNSKTFEVEPIDTMIAVKPQSLKYNHSLWDWLSKARETRAGWKPRILDWLAPNARVFLSFSDWYLFYDRLRHTPQQFVEMQIEELAKHSIGCEHIEVEKSNYDTTNGNVKLILVTG